MWTLVFTGLHNLYLNTLLERSKAKIWTQVCLTQSTHLWRSIEFQNYGKAEIKEKKKLFNSSWIAFGTTLCVSGDTQVRVFPLVAIISLLWYTFCGNMLLFLIFYINTVTFTTYFVLFCFVRLKSSVKSELWFRIFPSLLIWLKIWNHAQLI